MSDPYTVVPIDKDRYTAHYGPWKIKGPDGGGGELYFDKEAAEKKCETLNAKLSQTTLDLDE